MAPGLSIQNYEAMKFTRKQPVYFAAPSRSLAEVQLQIGIGIYLLQSSATQIKTICAKGSKCRGAGKFTQLNGNIHYTEKHFALDRYKPTVNTHQITRKTVTKHFINISSLEPFFKTDMQTAKKQTKKKNQQLVIYLWWRQAETEGYDVQQI